MAAPATHIYWRHYHEYGAEPELRAASVGARWAFWELLKLAARSASVGQVLVHGKVPDTATLAGIASAPSAEDMLKWISELVDLGILQRARNGRLDYAPMIRRAKTAEKRSKGGPSGGNPSLCSERKKRGKVNLKDNHARAPNSPRAKAKESSLEGSGLSPGAAPGDRVGDRGGGAAGGNVVALGVPRGWDPQGMAELVAEQFLALHEHHWPEAGQARLTMPRLTLKAEAQAWIDRGLGHSEFYEAFDGAMGRWARSGKTPPRGMAAFKLSLEDAVVAMERRA